MSTGQITAGIKETEIRASNRSAILEKNNKKTILALEEKNKEVLDFWELLRQQFEGVRNTITGNAGVVVNFKTIAKEFSSYEIYQ
jgi:hypothetical protein